MSSLSSSFQGLQHFPSFPVINVIYLYLFFTMTSFLFFAVNWIYCPLILFLGATYTAWCSTVQTPGALCNQSHHKNVGSISVGTGNSMHPFLSVNYKDAFKVQHSLSTLSFRNIPYSLLQHTRISICIVSLIFTYFFLVYVLQ